MGSLPKCPKCCSECTCEGGTKNVCPECAHEWAQDAAGSAEPGAVVRDAHGNELHDGDTVTVIKDLKVNGSSTVVKVGTRGADGDIVILSTWEC